MHDLQTSSHITVSESVPRHTHLANEVLISHLQRFLPGGGMRRTMMKNFKQTLTKIALHAGWSSHPHKLWSFFFTYDTILLFIFLGDRHDEHDTYLWGISPFSFSFPTPISFLCFIPRPSAAFSPSVLLPPVIGFCSCSLEHN